MRSPVPSPPLWRLVLGFVSGPAIAGVVFALVSPLYQGLPSLAERVERTFLIAIGIGYAVTAILGLPLFAVLRRRARPSLLNCALSGATVSTLPWALLGLLTTPNEASTGGVVTVHNHLRSAAGWVDLLQWLGGMAALGSIAGLVFWLCVAGVLKRTR